MRQTTVVCAKEMSWEEEDGYRVCCWCACVYQTPSAPVFDYSSLPVNTLKLAQIDENYMLPVQAEFVPYPAILYTVMGQLRFHAFLRHCNSLF